jgi:hypothetical protein
MVSSTPTIDQTLLFMSDEAWFQLGGFVNVHTTRYVVTENPHIIHKVPLHGQKGGVWYADSGRRITRSISLYDTANSELYVNAFQMFADEEKQYSYFQQDNATQQHITTFY